RSIQTSREGRISLAIASYRNNPKQSIRALAKAFDIPQSTLHTRIHGTLYSPRVAKIHLQHLLARSGCRALSRTSQSSRQSGLESLEPARSL
ncbi:hypothetical protein COCSADRAFT_76950, partial [Bipolaris sorokiniana ND90Pr]